MTTNEALTLPEYVRKAAGLGLAVRVYTYRCQRCRTETVKAQTFPAAIKGDLQILRLFDSMIGKANQPKCCGETMQMLPPQTMDGSLPA